MTVGDVVERARALVGSPFRAQGRYPATGLDCVGLVLQVFRIEPQQVRRDYRLRGQHGEQLEAELNRFFIPKEHAGAGDILLCAAGRDQMHLAIACGASFVHAHAGLRLVVETPGRPPWPVVGAFRHPELIQD